MKSQINIYLCFLLLLQPAIYYGQVNFSHGTKVFSSINGTDVFTSSWDDDRVTIPIGFDFEFRGEIYNEVDVKEVSLRMSNLGGIEDVIISPFNAKTIDRDYPNSLSSKVQYKTEGVPGNKVFIIQWENVGFENDLMKLDFVNIQIILYQENNVVEIIYGTSLISNPQLYFGGNGPKVSISKGLPYEYYSLEGMPSKPSLKVKDSKSSLTSYPNKGKYYLFSESESVGHNTILNNNNFNIYPNPVENTLYVQQEHSENTFYQISTINGKIIKVGELNLLRNKIDLSNIHDGIYFILFIKNKQTSIEKIIKSSRIN